MKRQDWPRQRPANGTSGGGLVSRRLEGLWAAPVVLLTAIILVSPAQAQPPITPNCDTGRDLILIPELRSDTERKLKALLMLSDEVRSMWIRKPGPGTTSSKGRCLPQRLRYLHGWQVADWNAPDPPIEPSTGDPVPGPTLRARIGDLIQISFRNQVDYTKNFPITLDRGDCDVATGTLPDPKDASKAIKVNVYPRNNSMPNCLHGSSTSNLHFHGTHTTPGTTGDNVLLYIRPALRVRVEGKSEPQIQPTDAVVKENFTKIFADCESTGSPTEWEQLPPRWRAEQKRLLNLYDATAPYRGQNANLPPALRLWPKNEIAIEARKWPQYSVGAFPYCFRLPDKPSDQKKDEGLFRMGQAPGTHWYHAHVHGSTALNVANGLAGAFIIEGPYDDGLRAFYNKTNPDAGLEEKVLVIQQLSTSLNLLSSTRSGPAFLSVNGRREPVITMRPDQVQMWRIVNAAYRSFVQFRNFTPVGVDWRQTAQDGVQFHPSNYERVGGVNAKFNMASGNRVDLLVKAPSTAGSYMLTVWESASESPTTKGGGTRVREVTLLTVKVEGTAIAPAMVFIDEKSFPTFSEFLENLPDVVTSGNKRDVAYDTTPGFTSSPTFLRGPLAGADPVLPTHTIDGGLFDDQIKQRMVLNSVEEWKVSNTAIGIAHPFHIHINPFQVVEVFDPNSAEATRKPTDAEANPCYADPTNPDTWRVSDDCDKLKLTPPFVWWDVRPIPAARDAGFISPAVECVQDKSADDKYRCPNSRGNACKPNSGGKQQCTVKIPGYFRMRSHFPDFPGVFVQHCHILAHEDVGMMQLVEVYDRKVGPRKGTIGLRHY
ncbi:MAG: multicopper oxidase domain-containing protein [Gammaproteobacteria bacterium]